MAITTLDGYIAAAKQQIQIDKTASYTTVAAYWSTLFHMAGNPGAGTLNVGNTANGLVPTDAVAGFPTINAFGALGYLAQVRFGNTVIGRMRLYDRLFHAGAYAYNANVTLASQPSYASRIVGGNYSETELWVEVVTAITGVLALTVTYTNQAGTTGRSTGSFSLPSGAIVGRMFQLPLQAGDTGIQKVESVLGATATAGTFNIVVLRPIWSGMVLVAGGGDVHGLDMTGLPQLFADSALCAQVAAASTASGNPEISLTIADG
jgi:hypothetical protein